MQKSIHGKRYNTETAKLLARVGTEALYQKRSGEYFLHADASAARERTLTAQNRCPDGTVILPMNAQQAKQWGESHLDAASCTALFGAVVEQEPRVLRVIAFSPDVLRRATDRATAEGLTLSDYVERVISNYLQNE